jgi:hypothetical protein
MYCANCGSRIGDEQTCQVCGTTPVDRRRYDLSIGSVQMFRLFGRLIHDTIAQNLCVACPELELPSIPFIDELDLVELIRDIQWNNCFA